MSTTIDERVVEMKFDNSDFEKNVKTSLNTLKELNKSIDTNLKDSATSLDGISKAVEGVSLDSLAEDINKIANRFSFLGIMAVTAMQKIANAAVDAGAKMVKALSIDQIEEGYRKYENKTKAVQMMVGNGYDMDEIQKAMSELMWFTDETSYNFTDMADNIGKFTANGRGLDESVKAMKGIALVAASSGAGIQEASRAMYNFSQALAMGSVRVQDWMSIENANMATKAFKEQIIETAKKLGTLKDVSNGVGKTVKGNTVDFQNFRSTLAEEWFTSDVLVQTLNNYSQFSDKLYSYVQSTGLSATELLGYMDDYSVGTMDMAKAVDKSGKSVEQLKIMLDELTSSEYEASRQAFAMGQETRTFGDMFNAVKDAVSSGWMNIFETIFGNYEEVTELWSTMVEDFLRIFADPISNIGDTLGEALNSPWDKLKGAITNAGVEATDFQTALENAAKNAGVDIDGLVEKYGTFQNSLKSGWLTKDIFNDAKNALSGFNKTVKETTKNYETIEDVAKAVWRGEFGSGTERYEKLTAAGWNYYRVQEAADDLWRRGEHTKVFDDVEKQGEAYGDLTDAINLTDEELNNLIDDLNKPSGRMLLFESLINIVRTVADVLGAVRTAFANAFNIDWAGSVYDTLEAFHSLTETLKPTEEQLQKLQSVLEIIFSVLGMVKDVLSGIITLAKSVLGGLLGPIISDIKDLLSSLDITSGGIKESLNNIGKSFKDWSKRTGTVIKDFISIGPGAFFAAFKGLIQAMPSFIKRIQNGIRSMFSGDMAAMIGGFPDLIDRIFEKISGSNFLNGLRKSLSTELSNLYNELFVDISYMSTFLKSIFDSLFSGDFVSAFGKIKEEVVFQFNYLMSSLANIDWSNVFTNIYTSVTNFGKNMFSKIKNMFKTETKQIAGEWVQLKNLPKIVGILDGVWSELFSRLPQTMKNALTSIGKWVTSTTIKIKKLVSDLKNLISPKLTIGLEKLSSGFSKVADTVKAVASSTKNFFSKLTFASIFSFITSIPSKIKALIASLKTIDIAQVFGNIADKFKSLTGINLQPFFDSVLEFVKSIPDKAKVVFDRLKEITGIDIQQGIENLRSALEKIPGILSDIESKIPQGFKKFLEVIADMFGGPAQSALIDGSAEDMQMAFEGIPNLITSFKDKFKKLKSDLQNAYNGIMEDYGSFINGLKEKTSTWNWPAILGIGSIAISLKSLANSVKKTKQMLEKTKGSFDGIKEAISSFGSNTLKKFQNAWEAFGNSWKEFGNFWKTAGKSLKTKSFYKVALGILALAGAMLVLILAVSLLGRMWEENRERLIAGTIAVFIIGVVLAGLAVAASKLVNVVSPWMAVGILAMALAVLVIIGAINMVYKQITKLGFNEQAFVKAIGIVGGIILALGIFALLATATAGSCRGLGFAMVGLVIAIGAIILIVKKLSEAEGVFGNAKFKLMSRYIGELIILLGVFSLLAGLGGGLKSVGGTLIALAITITIVASIATKLARLKGEKFDKALESLNMLRSIIYAIAVFAAVLGAISIFGGSFKGSASLVVAIAAAVIVISAAVKIIANIPAESLANATPVMWQLMGILIILSLVSVLLVKFAGSGTNALLGAATIAILAASLVIAAASLAILGNMTGNLQQAMEAIVLLSLMMALLGAIGGSVGIMAGVTIAIIAGSLLLAAASFLVAAIGIEKMNEVLPEFIDVLKRMGTELDGSMALTIGEIGAALLVFGAGSILTGAGSLLLQPEKLNQFVDTISKLANLPSGSADNISALGKALKDFGKGEIWSGLGSMFGTGSPMAMLADDTSRLATSMSTALSSFEGIQSGSAITTVADDIARLSESLPNAIACFDDVGRAVSGVADNLTAPLNDMMTDFDRILSNFKQKFMSFTRFISMEWGHLMADLRGQNASTFSDLMQKATSSCEAVITQLQTVYDKVTEIKSGMDEMTSLSGILGGGEGEGQEANAFVGSLLASLQSMAGDFQAAGSEAGNALAAGIGSTVSISISEVSAIVSAAVSELSSMYSEFYSAGVSAGEGAAAGIRSMSGAVAAAARALAQTANSAYRGALRINSPSKVFMESSYSIPEGAAKGIEKKTYLVTDAIKGMVKKLSTPNGSLLDAISSTFDNQEDIVITPIIDLSQVQQSAGEIKSLLDVSSSRSIAATINTQREAFSSNNQNGINSNAPVLNNTTNIYPRELDKATMDYVINAVNRRLGARV